MTTTPMSGTSTLAGTTRRLTYSGATGSRDYEVYIPSGLRGDPVPLLVMLHGGNQDAADFAAGTRMNDFAEHHSFVVVYPEQSRAANSSGYWNWYRPEDQQADAGEPAIIAGITHEVMRELPIDQHRVWIAGLSAGGAMAAVMAATHPDLFTAVGVHSGLAARAGTDLSSGLAALRGVAREPGVPREMPTIVFHGDRDAVVNPVNGVQVIEASLGIDCPYETWEHTGPDGRRFTRRNYVREGSGVRGEHWTLHGAAHAWSGGSTAGTFADALGPDASEEMLGFFETVRRLGSD